MGLELVFAKNFVVLWPLGWVDVMRWVVEKSDVLLWREIKVWEDGRMGSEWRMAVSRGGGGDGMVELGGEGWGGGDDGSEWWERRDGWK